MGAIDVLHVATTKGDDELLYRRCLLWGEKEMHVIGHQDIGVEFAFGLAKCFT